MTIAEIYEITSLNLVNMLRKAEEGMKKVVSFDISVNCDGRSGEFYW